MLLLADVFENFTSESLKVYKVDPSYYFSSPELIWDAMLKMTGIQLELILDIDRHVFIAKGLRGGISYICKRFSEANNKYLKNYDPTRGNKLFCILIKTIYMAGKSSKIFLIVILRG